MSIHVARKEIKKFLYNRINDNTKLYWYDMKDGAELTEFYSPGAGNIYGHGIASDAAGNVYFATGQKKVFCVDKDGNLVWSKTLSDQYVKARVTPDGVYLLLVGDASSNVNKLSLFNASDGSFIRDFSQLTNNDYMDGVILPNYKILFARRDVGNTAQRGAVLDIDGNVLQYLDSFDCSYPTYPGIAFSPYCLDLVAAGTNGKTGYTFFDLNTGEKVTIGMDVYITSRPLLDSEGNFYGVDSTPTIKKFKRNTNELIWQTTVSAENDLTLGFIDETNRVILASSLHPQKNTFYMFDMDTGEILMFGGSVGAGSNITSPAAPYVPDIPPAPAKLHVADSKDGSNTPVAGISGLDDDYIQAQAITCVPLDFKDKDSDLIIGKFSSFFDCARHSKAVVRALISDSSATVKIRPVRKDINGTKIIGQEVTLSVLTPKFQEGSKYLCEDVSFDTLGAKEIGILVSSTPTLSTPSNFSATAANGGSLDGTYYYKVAAYVNGGYTDLSSEANATVDGGTTNGTINLSWDAVTGATKYRVFRGTSANGEDEAYEVTSNSLADDGSLTWIGDVALPTENEASTCTVDVQISGA